MTAAVPTTQVPAERVSLLTIYLTFLRMGAFAFGGGTSSWVYREAVMLRGWLDDQEFTAGLALSQLLPGTNIGNLAVFVGMRLRGFPGACMALLGLLTAPFFAVLLLLWVYDYISGAGWLDQLLSGIAAAALGLLLLTGYRTATRGSRTVWAWTVLAATFVMVAILQWPLLPVAFTMAPLSVAGVWWMRRKRPGA